MGKIPDASVEDSAGQAVVPRTVARRERCDSVLVLIRAALKAIAFLAVFLELIYITSIPAVQRVLFGEAQVGFYKKNHDLLLSKTGEVYNYIMTHYSRYVHCALWSIGIALGLSLFYVCYGRRVPWVRGIVRSVGGVGRFFNWLWIHL